MESFKWGPQFLTNIPEVDEQHRALVVMINDYGKALSEDRITEDYIYSTFRELARYAQFHFDTEERIMAKAGIDFRHIESHLNQHSNFVNDISDLIDTMNVENADDTRSLFEYLVHWLAYHILGADKNMAQQLHAIEKGESADLAFTAEEREASGATEPLLVALNGLFTLVQRRNKALVDLTRNLEKRVAERTRELSRANEALQIISITDHLTQLPNRRFAMSQLDLHWKEAHRLKLPISCLMIDADGFKRINDTYGHDAGDVVLQRLADELKDSVRSDDIVCRLGGDEFFIICPNTSLEGALQLGKQTLHRISGLKVAAGDGFWLGSVSIGVASATAEMVSIDDLIKAADKAVYLAKNEGRNCVRTG